MTTLVTALLCMCLVALAAREASGQSGVCDRLESKFGRHACKLDQLEEGTKCHRVAAAGCRKGCTFMGDGCKLATKIQKVAQFEQNFADHNDWLARLQQRLDDQQNDIGNLRTDTDEISRKQDDLTDKTDDTKRDIHDIWNEMDRSIYRTPTSTYVHWGRTECPQPPEWMFEDKTRHYETTLYSGVLFSAPTTQKGGAASYLCLPTNFPRNNDRDMTAGAAVNGLVVGGYGSGPNINDEVPCAVCPITTGVTIITPGKHDCYEGYSKGKGSTHAYAKYTGFLMSSAGTGAGRGEYICVDDELEGVRNGAYEPGKGAAISVTQKDGKDVRCTVCMMDQWDMFGNGK